MNKRQHSSTASEQTDTSLLDSSVFDSLKGQKSKKDSKKKKVEDDAPKQKSIKSMLSQQNAEVTTEKSIRSIETRLDEVSLKLSTVLTKDDTSVIRTIIRETIDELKDKLLSSVIKRLEIIESNVFDQSKEIDTLHIQINNKNKEIEELKTKLNKSEMHSAESLNELKQYSRRNNLRINGLQSDTEFQSSISVTEQVSSLLNTKLKLKVQKEDIDVAHRLGKFNREARPVIVKFVRRQTKADVMRNAKLLKRSGVFLN
ncbi:hypothetical protein DPMN_039297 [Dreissena polymorpha]|uniref:Uncharacterized protein n=1 Tax=Dreissena polymorpha TaxID=45954 RepID=A0A9D4RRJ7_DREPO|nr:hypothetical protein DPMN_039297 [Dreissena polymorpha]